MSDGDQRRKQSDSKKRSADDRRRRRRKKGKRRKVGGCERCKSARGRMRSGGGAACFVFICSAMQLE